VSVSDQTVIVMPADSTYAGQWEIRKDSNVTVKKSIGKSANY